MQQLGLRGPGRYPLLHGHGGPAREPLLAGGEFPEGGLRTAAARARGVLPPAGLLELQTDRTGYSASWVASC